MSIYSLAVLLKSMKKFEEAEELFREDLAACNSPSMLSVSFSLHRCYDSQKMADPLLFSEFSAETGLAKADHVMENTTKRPCLPGGIWRSFSRTSHPAATVLGRFQTFGSQSVEESNLCRSAERWRRHRNFCVWPAELLSEGRA